MLLRVEKMAIVLLLAKMKQFGSEKVPKLPALHLPRPVVKKFPKSLYMFA